MIEPVQPASSVEPALKAAPKGPSGGLVDWFWRGQALRHARAFRSRLPISERQALERARVANELGDRAYDPIDPLRAGSSLAVSISLYREAAYWGLLAQSSELAGVTLGALFEQAPSELLEFAAGSADELPLVRRALVERSFVETAALPPELLPQDARVAKTFVAALLRTKLAPETKVGRLLLQRGARCLGLLGVLLVAALLTWQGIAKLKRGPDLAAGKPWQASSSPDKCQPAEHRCAGAHTDMFFTTSEEVSPWVEIDLGKETTFNQVEVTNRDDCCPDRAAPLLVEVSHDRSNWREVSRRDDTFTVWQSEFARQTSRYLRLRVPRRTILHLVKVSVRNAG
jgi:F5/8 type C domain